MKSLVDEVCSRLDIIDKKIILKCPVISGLLDERKEIIGTSFIPHMSINFKCIEV